MNLSLTDYIAGVENGSLNPQDVLNYYINQTRNDQYNAYVTTTDQYAHEHLTDFSTKSLKGAPIAIKDIILTKGVTTTGASKMLEQYIAPYSATCFAKLEQAGGLMIGKTNMDEFAMGASGEHSAMEATINPHGTNRIPGGSSSGSAAAVAADLCIAALGTDTGGSVRQPAALCGIVGVKPTYGRISRYGVQPMASSFDQIGTFTKTVADAALLLETMSGSDIHDPTSVPRPQSEQQSRKDSTQTTSLEGMKFLLPNEFLGQGLDPHIHERINEVVSFIESKGGVVDRGALPILTSSLAAYYTLVTAEVSTNYSRFDGVRFGVQDNMDKYESYHEYVCAMRSQGFGEEVKRRILLGTYVLSSANYEGYYAKAQKVRAKLAQEINQQFEKYNAIIGPTTPTVAWKIGETSDPMNEYLADVYTVPANLCGLPGMSVPVGTVNDQGDDMPVGFQILTKQRDEETMFKVGAVIEKYQHSV